MTKPSLRHGLLDRLKQPGFLRYVLMYALSLAVLLGLWWGASALVKVWKDGRELLPNPARSISEMVRLAHLWFPNFLVSAWRLVLAILISFSLGYPLGLLLGRERRLDELISPMIYIVYPIPQVAFILVLFLVFGIGDTVKVAIVALALFFQILISARGAAKSIEDTHVTSVVSAGASRWQVYRHVILPATLPSILTSLRVSIGLGMAFLYIAETYVTIDPRRGGLGAFIRSQSAFNAAQAFAGILAMALLGLILYVAIDLIERLVCRWRYTARRSS